MKHLQKIFLFFIPLSTMLVQSKAEIPLSHSTNDLKELVQTSENIDESPAKDSLEIIKDDNSSPDQDISAYGMWENHLKTLDQNWSNNAPDSNWLSQATTLANNAIKANSGLTSQLQNEFLAAINGKIQQGESLTLALVNVINNFNDSIGETTQEHDENKEKDEEKEKEELVNEKDVISEEPSVEDANEKESPAKISLPEITSTSTDNFNDSSHNSPSRIDSTKKDTNKLNEQWQSALHKLAFEGVSQAEAEQLISHVRAIGQQLVEEGVVDAERVNDALTAALQDRKKNKKLYSISMQGSPDDNIEDVSEPMKEESLQQQNPNLQKDLHKVEQEIHEQKDLIQKQALAANRDKQRMDIEMQNLAQQVAMAKASQFSISPDQAERIIDAKIKTIKAEQEKKAASAQKEFQEKLLVAAAKRTRVEKGIIASAMDAVSNWWSGKSATETQKDSLNKQQEALLNEMVSHYTDEATKIAIRTAWISLYDAFTAIKDDKYWDSINKRPKPEWIQIVKESIETLTITHQVMPLLDACDIVIQVLNTQKDMTAQNRAITIEAVRKDLQNKEFATQKAEREKEEQDRLRRETAMEKKKRIEEKLLRIKIAEDKAKELKAFDQRSKQKFTQQKVDWDLFIKNLSEQKDATEAQNDESTREAIKKAKTLLDTAFYDASQDIYALEQLLKEQFTNALLTQKRGNKNNTEHMRTHQNMDRFNKAINVIVEGLEKF